MIVLVQYLRVNGLKREWWIDLPELTSIQLGYNAFCFKSNAYTELIMRSDDDEMNWWIDLPKLTSLTTEVDYSSGTFLYPQTITLEGIAFTLSSPADMPSLTTVVLFWGRAFTEKKAVHTKSVSSSSCSFLDITYALERYLRFTVSFTCNLHLCQFQSSPLYHSFSLKEYTHS